MLDYVYSDPGFLVAILQRFSDKFSMRANRGIMTAIQIVYTLTWRQETRTT